MWGVSSSVLFLEPCLSPFKSDTSEDCHYAHMWCSHCEFWQESLGCFGGRGLDMSRKLLSAAKTSISTGAFWGTLVFYAKWVDLVIWLESPCLPTSPCWAHTLLSSLPPQPPSGLLQQKPIPASPHLAPQRGPAWAARQRTWREKWTSAPTLLAN